jgi:hypothetical protein
LSLYHYRSLCRYPSLWLSLNLHPRQHRLQPVRVVGAVVARARESAAAVVARESAAAVVVSVLGPRNPQTLTKANHHHPNCRHHRSVGRGLLVSGASGMVRKSISRKARVNARTRRSSLTAKAVLRSASPPKAS